VHPVIAYEMIWNMLSLILIWKLRNRLRPDGMLFALYLVLYSLGRFGISFLRQDKVWALGMQEAHFIALAVLVITVPLLIIKARPIPAGEVAAATPPPSRDRRSRAERRRDRS
jgi:phosphatidylglycerol:prolipoprotein diacylglycerol transferase